VLVGFSIRSRGELTCGETSVGSRG